MVKIFLVISKFFHMNENASKIIITIFVFLLIIGLIWGRILYNKDNLVKKLIGKFYYKYITLCMLICVMISAIIAGIIQFLYKDILGYAVFITLCLGIISLVWAFIHDRISLFRYYPNDERLDLIFKYFNCKKISYLKYEEMITWISRWIHHFFKKRNDNNVENELIQKLDLLLRPYNNGLCLAFHHKTDFIELCKTLCKDDQKDQKIKHIVETYDSIKNKEYEKNKLLRNMLSDKNIMWYIGIMILHAIGCSCISRNLRDFFGNFFLYIPGDILLLLFYYGIVKQQKIEH